MQLKGKIIVVIPPKSGTTEKGDWQSQQYVLETQEEHPKKLLFEVFGENKIKEFDIKQDEVLTVSFDPKVDEKDGHYYGKNRAFAVSGPQDITCHRRPDPQHYGRVQDDDHNQHSRHELGNGYWRTHYIYI